MNLNKLDALPNLPQVSTLKRTAELLWQKKEVQAIWLGGSFASDKADGFSDIDLRIAMSSEDMEKWKQPNWNEVFGQASLGGSFMEFGSDSFLHHLVLEDGTIFDFFVQSLEHKNYEHAILVLACRNEMFGRSLSAFGRTISEEALELNPESARLSIASFWINSHKHRKAIGRGLSLMLFIGIHNEKMALLRLWRMLHEGRDMNSRPSIHSLADIVETIQQEVGNKAFELIGKPLRTEEEALHCIDSIRDEVSDIGRHLAKKYNFSYPSELEQVVRKSWAEFLSMKGMLNQSSHKTSASAPN